jgi:uncharacterized cupredoxin-like copper-binding protein
MRRSRLGSRVFFLAAGLAALVPVVPVLAARAGGDSQTPVLNVAERDFHISAPERAHVGRVRIVVRNEGPDTHELLVIRNRTGRLPLRADGLTVNEEALERSTVATVDAEAPGTEHSVVLELPPGRYELLCNMAGHYLGGMRHVLMVR